MALRVLSYKDQYGTHLEQDRGSDDAQTDNRHLVSTVDHVVIAVSYASVAVACRCRVSSVSGNAAVGAVEAFAVSFAASHSSWSSR